MFKKKLWKESKEKVTNQKLDWNEIERESWSQSLWIETTNRQRHPGGVELQLRIKVLCLRHSVYSSNLHYEIILFSTLFIIFFIIIFIMIKDLNPRLLILLL